MLAYRKTHTRHEIGIWCQKSLPRLTSVDIQINRQEAKRNTDYQFAILLFDPDIKLKNIQKEKTTERLENIMAF